MRSKPDRSDPRAEAVGQQVEAQDKRVKALLVIVSLAVVAALIYDGLRDEVFPEWRAHQREYGKLLVAKATDEAEREAADAFKPAVRQVVLPDRGIIDRCISCHVGVDDPRMSDAPQPHTSHPGDYLKWHPTNEFGCTACHDGDGRALTWDDARGDEHWDFPLLPVGLTQASCGRCHGGDDIAESGGRLFALGETLYLTKGCSSCHKIGGRGGSMGPDLDSEGLKIPQQLDMTHVEGPHTVAQWLTEHFEDPQRIVPESQMKQPQLSYHETQALTLYMLSLGDRGLPVSVLAPSKHNSLYQQSGPLNMTGEELYERFCASCHDTGTYGRYDEFYTKFIPAVRGATYTLVASDEYVDENIRRGRPGTLMPAWGETGGGLSDDEITRIREFLMEPTGGPTHDMQAGPLAGGAVGGLTWDATRGAEAFARHCAACHGPEGSDGPAPELSNEVFQESASEMFIWLTIALGRRNTAMPSFLAPDSGGLSAADISDLVAHVRTFSPATPTVSAIDEDPQASLRTAHDSRRLQ